jgi:hypothetical protein
MSGRSGKEERRLKSEKAGNSSKRIQGETLLRW